MTAAAGAEAVVAVGTGAVTGSLTGAGGAGGWVAGAVGIARSTEGCFVGSLAVLEAALDDPFLDNIITMKLFSTTLFSSSVVSFLRTFP